LSASFGGIIQGNSFADRCNSLMPERSRSNLADARRNHSRNKDRRCSSPNWLPATSLADAILSLRESKLDMSKWAGPTVGP
jgi:hypothetical protein